VIKEIVEREGQRFVDSPIYARPKDRTILANEIMSLFGTGLPKPIKIGHERVMLRWMKPVHNPRWKRLLGAGEFARNPDGTIKLEPR
jgi:hypothetical protein